MRGGKEVHLDGITNIDPILGGRRPEGSRHQTLGSHAFIRAGRCLSGIDDVRRLDVVGGRIYSFCCVMSHLGSVLSCVLQPRRDSRAATVVPPRG
jgi:hypothetical protein